MTKYRLVKATDHEGNSNGVLEHIEKNYSSIGTIPYLDRLGVGSSLLFVYDNGSELGMQTSSLKEISVSETEIKAVTRNSIYYFEKVEEPEGRETAYGC